MFFSSTIKLRKYIPLLLALLGGWYYFVLPYKLFNSPTSTIVESDNGQLIGAKIANDHQWRFPAPDSLSKKYVQCLISFEDRRFYQHYGIDGWAIVRALWQNIKSHKIREGGSTITMQVVRLMRKDKSRTIKEKVVEALLATRIELRYTKNEIIHLYAANAPFGGNVVGLEAASWRYYGRPSFDLSWAEAATLAVLPNVPALIHPGRNRTALLNKRNKLLETLCLSHIIDEEDLLLAKAEPLPEKPLPLPSLAPHLLERIAKTNNGQRVVTSLNYPLQQRANETVNRHINQLRGNSIHNAAAIIIDNETNSVIAYVGNANIAENEEHGEKVDIVTAPRSTGSILKPFLYATMIAEGEILPNTLIPDIPTYITGFVPQNFDKGYDGAVAAHHALERSLNIPTVRMLQNYGVDKFHDLLKKVGLTTLIYSPSHYGLSLILGGAEASLWDITSAYASMSRTLVHFRTHDGQYFQQDWDKPSFIKIETTEHTNQKKHTNDRDILNAASIWLTFESLSNVNRPEEESMWRMFPSSRRVAWKTGTSYGNRDAWAVGTTDKYTVGVWVGNASGEGRPMLTGVGSAAPILFDLFNMLPSTGWFQQPFDEMTYVSICRKSGYRSTNLCSETDSMWVANEGLDTPPCPHHIMVHLDPAKKYRVNTDCVSAHDMISQSWFVLPPAQEWYYKQKHHDYKTLPPIHPDCLASMVQKPMEIIYPQNNLSILITKQMDGSEGKIVLQATHRRSDATVYWHLDEHYIGSTTRQHHIAILPDTGSHTITLVDEEGMSVRGSFKIEQKK